MKFMLMMSATQADFAWYAQWPKEALREHTAFMNSFNKELMDAGQWVTGEGLAFPNEAKVVRAGKSGEPVIDGAFAETKEFLAGFWIVEVENAEEAYRLAARASAAPHPPHPSGGNQAIEVRQVMSGPPEV